MKSIFSILIFFPIFCLGQINTKYYTKKQEVKGLISYIDSSNIILNSKIESLLKQRETNQANLEKLKNKQAKIQLASTYLKKAKRRITIGNIVSGVTFLTAFISFQQGISPSSGFVDLSEIYLAAAGVLVLTGQAINISLKISSKEKIQKAKELIKEVN